MSEVVAPWQQLEAAALQGELDYQETESLAAGVGSSYRSPDAILDGGYQRTDGQFDQRRISVWTLVQDSFGSEPRIVLMRRISAF